MSGVVKLEDLYVLKFLCEGYFSALATLSILTAVSWMHTALHYKINHPEIQFQGKSNPKQVSMMADE